MSDKKDACKICNLKANFQFFVRYDRFVDDARNISGE